MYMYLSPITLHVFKSHSGNTGTDFIGSCKSNYHMITTAPALWKNIYGNLLLGKIVKLGTLDSSTNKTESQYSLYNVESGIKHHKPNQFIKHNKR
jgi:hypothetical protein